MIKCHQCDSNPKTRPKFRISSGRTKQLPSDTIMGISNHFTLISSKRNPGHTKWWMTTESLPAAHAIYFGMKLYMFPTVRLSIIRRLFTVHSALVYVIQVCRHTPLMSVRWIISWWWTDELSETCRVSCQNKFVKLVRLVGFIIKKFVAMYGHMDVKKKRSIRVLGIATKKNTVPPPGMWTPAGQHVNSIRVRIY